jgi:cytochrome c oxidase subunit 2
VVATALLLSGCQLPSFGAYKGETAQGHDSFKLYQGFFVAGICVFALVFCLILWSILRYRKKSDEIPRQFQYHTVFEVFYTIVPVIIVIVLFVFTFITENEVTNVSHKATIVDVTAFQWGWQFKYPAYKRAGTNTPVRVLGVEVQDPVMEVPAGETIHVFLRSKDVIHGFYVPQFNYSEYAQPGHLNQFDLTIQHTGTYRGQCTQFCGLYHTYMIFRVRAVTPAQFQAWVTAKESAPTTLASVTAAKQQAKGGLR